MLNIAVNSNILVKILDNERREIQLKGVLMGSIAYGETMFINMVS